MKRLKSLFIAVALVLGVGAVTLVPASGIVVAKGVNPSDEIKKGVNGAGGQGQNNLRELIQTVVNVLLFVLGAIAVIVIVIGGIKYTTSDGDSGKISSAKNTILYAVIGLIVAIMAYAIVNFIVNAF